MLTTYLRILLFFAFLFTAPLTHAQVTTDTTTKQQYAEAYNKLPEDIRKNIESIAEDARKEGLTIDLMEVTSIAFMQVYATDTLNLNSLKKGVVKPLQTKEAMLLCNAEYRHDTLYIEIGAGGQDSYEGLHIAMFNNNVIASYNEYREYDSVFSNTQKGPRLDYITVPATVNKLVLSSNAYKQGGVIYGYCDITSMPYFIDDDNFYEGYMKQRLLAKVLFKCVVKVKGK